MQTNKELFQKNGYLKVPNIIENYQCEKLTKKFKELIDTNQTETDEMCPKSYSIYAPSFFDDLLEQLKPRIENIIGDRLFPTYSFARWYVQGESLFKHIDRPSCEISATLTLDFDGDAWPFYVADIIDNEEKNVQKVILDISDAVIYKGLEKLHWREEYQGSKQVQVFLHYVLQNGKHCDWKYDMRNKLSHH